MSMASEFKEFALKGNVMDMAVGIIIGGAFGKIIASLVNDVLMPIIGKFVGGISTSFTKDDTILPNAPPMMIPTAMSITLPRIAKALNSFIMLMLCSLEPLNRCGAAACPRRSRAHGRGCGRRAPGVVSAPVLPPFLVHTMSPWRVEQC